MLNFSDFSKIDENLVVVKSGDFVLESIRIPKELTHKTLCFVKSQKFLAEIDLKKKLNETALIIDESFYARLSEKSQEEIGQAFAGVMTSKNLALSVAKFSRLFFENTMGKLNCALDGRKNGRASVDPDALISENVFLGENVEICSGVVIHPGVVVMPNVKIEEGTEIFPQVTIYPFTQIGKNCRIHAGTTIGSDGFGYTFHQGEHVKTWHFAGTIIEDDVEIGSNCSVDMGAFTPTVIGKGTRIDNLVQVAHNVKIGKGCVLCGASGVSGSAILEDYVVLGGKAGVGPDAHLGQGTQVAGSAMVNESATWPAGSKLGGHPARDLSEWMRGFAWVRKMSLKK